MKHIGYLNAILLSITLIGLSCTGSTSETMPAATEANPEDPTLWEEEITALTADDAVHPPPADAFLFIGSSSIRLWETLAEDMAPLPVIRRGFGGSKLGDAIYYIDRLVTPYRPRAVVVFSGSNDIAGENPKQPEEVLALYRQFVEGVHERLPATPIYYIAITPTWSRWEHHELVEEANRLIESYSASSDDLYFIDTASAIVDENGEPRKELFREDQLHLNAEGYKIWTTVIKPILMASTEPAMAYNR